MKQFSFSIARLLIPVLLCVFSSDVSAQNAKDQAIIDDAVAAKAEFIKADANLETIFTSSYGYAIFPNVGKGGFLIGGASGNGAVYEGGALVGMAKLTQVTIGIQWGGQAYREVIFFENKEAMDKFKERNYELSAQASAVAVTAGASATATYQQGVMIFTQAKGGLMYEASVGGQRLKYRAL